MSDRNESHGGGYGLPALALLSLLATLFTPGEESFATTRTRGTTVDESSAEGRLWHDPLARQPEVRTLPSDPGKAAKALLIAVPETMSAEDVESRRRTRFALHAAMSACDFHPADATRVYGLALPDARPNPADSGTEHHDTPRDGTTQRSDPGNAAPATTPTGALLAFEEFRNGQTTILAFWLPERCFEQQLGKIHAAIVPLATTIACLGPTTSDSLARTNVPDQLQLYSPWVTAPADSKARLKPFLCADSALAKTLDGELRRRGIGSSHRILLVLERDSAFARAWQQALANAGRDGSAERRLSAAWYTRGLDGTSMLPNQDAKSGAAGSRIIEPPNGAGTIDYLRRLRSEFRQGHDGDFDAIGVFGRDIHDKLLILQALRPAFPEAVFFTSDLDAYYCHPSQLPHTRNLVVASGHGLLPEPHRHDDDAGPAHPHADEGIETPFRDAYQTAAYCAMHEFLCGHAVITPPNGLLFEVGSHGPVRLDDPHGNRWSALLWNALALVLVLACGALAHWWLNGGKAARATAKFMRAHRLWHLAVLTVIALQAVSWLIMWLGAEPVHWTDGVSVWPTEVARLLALTLAMVFAYHVLRALRRVTFWTRDPDHESRRTNAPTLWSMACSTAERATSGIRRSFGNARTLLQLWLFGMSPPLADGRRTVMPTSSTRATPPPGPTTPMAMRLPGQTLNDKAKSALAMALAFLGVGITLIVALGVPHTPVRDRIVFVFDKVILFASVLALLWLTFLVIEVTRQCVARCRSLGRRLPSGRGGPAIDDWHAARTFLATVATAGGKGIYGPFIVLLVLCLARWRGFDDWTWPLGLQIVMFGSAALVLLAHVSLHRTALQVRDRAIRELSLAIELDNGATRRLGLIRDDLKALNHGIFAGPANHPMLRALVIPFTGLGSLSLLQWIQVL
ncbi:MAG: hypothetical protein IPK26_01870 [Planctomycetes bacterium]|nr:hypothetical protein [Planctomycetota bacterium]